MAGIDLKAIEPNSHTYKEEKKIASMGEKSSLDTKKEANEKTKLKPVVKKDNIVTTKKPLGKRLASIFTEKDWRDIRNYIIFDWLIPGIKNGILDILSLMFFDEIRSDSKSRKRRDRERTSYGSYYRGETSRSSNRDKKQYRDDDKVDYRNIVLEHRDDAEDVVDALQRRIEKTGAATIADLMDLIDETSRFTDNNWGWTRTRDIGIRRVSRGYLIDVAEAEYLED